MVVIGAMQVQSPARLAVVDNGVPPVAEAEAKAEAHPSVVALHALILFQGRM